MDMPLAPFAAPGPAGKFANHLFGICSQIRSRLCTCASYAATNTACFWLLRCCHVFVYDIVALVNCGFGMWAWDSSAESAHLHWPPSSQSQCILAASQIFEPSTPKAYSRSRRSQTCTPEKQTSRNLNFLISTKPFVLAESSSWSSRRVGLEHLLDLLDVPLLMRTSSRRLCEKGWWGQQPALRRMPLAHAGTRWHHSPSLACHLVLPSYLFENLRKRSLPSSVTCDVIAPSLEFTETRVQPDSK